MTRKALTRGEIAALLASRKGILLDVSFGGKPQSRSVTMGPAGNLKHLPTQLPFPLPNACVHTAVVTHVLEFLDPANWFKWWDELHRVMQPYGTVYINGPYGGDESQGWLSDPTHKTRVVEQSFVWLDPRMPFYVLHESLGRKAPLPWHTQALARVPGTHGTFSYNAVLQPVEREKPKKKRRRA